MNLDTLLVGVGVVLAILAAAAFAIAAQAALRLPRRGCPRCRYDLAASGPLPLVCPECGLRVESEAKTRRPLFTRRGAIVGSVFLLLAVSVFLLRFREPVLRAVLPAWRELDAVSQGPWQVRVLERRDQSQSPPEMPRRIEVRFGGRIVSAFEGFLLRAGASTLTAATTIDENNVWPPPLRYPDLGSPDRLPAAGTPGMLGDGDGDGRLDLAIEDPSGGSGGYTTTYLFALEPSGSATPTAILDNVFLVRRDDESGFIAIGFDPQFAYRWTSGAGSPRPRVVLAPDGSVPRSNWRCDADAMRVPPPNDAQWQALLDRVRAGARRAQAASGPDADPSSEPWLAPLLATFCDLAYGGEVELAWRFLDEAWPTDGVVRWGEPLDRDAFAAELAEALAASRCAEALGFPGGPPRVAPAIDPPQRRP